MKDTDELEKNTVSGSDTSRTNPGRYGGSLKVGNPGNKGGHGRIPSEVRSKCVQAFEESIDSLKEIAVNGRTEGIRIKAIATLGNYGLGQKTEVSLSDPAVLDRFIQATKFFISPDHYDEWLNAVRDCLKDV